MATALNALLQFPATPFVSGASPTHELRRLRAALGPQAPTLLIKRDDLLTFGLGGNKVRKIQTVAAEAQRAGADTLITCGGVQSNHARVTAAAGAALGMRVMLVANGAAPTVATGNARLNALFGAEMIYVSSRDERAPAMARAAAAAADDGRKPFVIPVGASTPVGAIGFAKAMQEIAAAPHRPTAIVHATSSGGTQAGLIIGSALFGLTHEVIGISADDPADTLRAIVAALIAGAAPLLGAQPATIGAHAPVLVDDTFVGGGYGVPTPQSVEALELVARTEGILLDPVYTAKAMAGLIARVRAGVWRADDTVLFWHTGGGPGYFG